MGMWVILIGDSNLTINRFQDMKFIGNKEIIKTEHSIDVIYENGYAHFYDDTGNYIIGDYTQSEIEKFPFSDVRMIMLKYSDIQILKKIIGEDDFPDDIIIDYDGENIRLNDILGREIFKEEQGYGRLQCAEQEGMGI